MLEGFKRRFRIYRVVLWAAAALMLGGPILASQLVESSAPAAVLAPLLLGGLVMCATILLLVADMSYSMAPEGRRVTVVVGAVAVTALLTGALMALAEWLVF